MCSPTHSAQATGVSALPASESPPFLTASRHAFPTPPLGPLPDSKCRLLPSQPGQGPRAAIHANPAAGLMRRSGQVPGQVHCGRRMPEVIQKALLPSDREASPRISFDPASTGEGPDEGGA